MPNRRSQTAGRRLGLWCWVLAVCYLSLLLASCRGETAGGAISASGFIEGDEIVIAPEVGGRIAEVLVDEGDTVRPGQVLAHLDDALLQTHRGEALAAVAAAEANLARVEAGARPAEIGAARAGLTQAEAQRAGALRALEHARQALQNPQELDLQIIEAETQVALAEQEEERAEADLGKAESRYAARVRQTGQVDHAQYRKVEARRAALEAAQARLDGARRYRDALYAIRANPLTLLAQTHTSEAQCAMAEAAVEAARAALDELEAGPTQEETALAQAHLHQAQAALNLVDAQLARLTLSSPIGGIVTSRSAHAGETAAPGVTLLTLANLDRVTLVIYIPETQIGRVQVGQPVEVTVDSFPDQVFTGSVATIAGEAEFTPRSVQTREERVNLVFAVKVLIPNPGHFLKPGMPADAIIHP